MGFQPFGTFMPDGRQNNRFSDLYVDSLWLSHELRLMDKAAILSNNFVSGSAGFKLEYDGSAELNDVTIRGTITASTFQTAEAGNQRLVIDGAAGDKLMTFYESDDSVVGYIGMGVTGWGATDLGISTAGGLDSVFLEADGANYLKSDGVGGLGNWIESKCEGAVGANQKILAIIDSNIPSEIASFGIATQDIVLGNPINIYARRTEQIWLASKEIQAYLWNSAGTAQDYAFQAYYRQLQGNASAGASAPAFSFIGDAGLGMYRYSANTLGFATNSTFAGYIDSSANWVFGHATGGYAVIRDAANDANNTTYSWYNDADTGLMWVTADSQALVAGGRNVIRVREVSGKEYVDFKDTGELWWYGDQAYASTTNRAYRWWINTGSYDTFTLNVRDTAGNYYTNLEFVDGKMRIPETYNRTSGSVTNIVMSSSGELFRSTSARKYKSRINYNVDYLADLTLAPAKFYRKDDKQWFYGFVADDLGDQDKLLGEWGEDEIENYDQRAVMAVMAAKINRLERLLEVT